jgi:hypothetical protein
MWLSKRARNRRHRQRTHQAKGAHTTPAQKENWYETRAVGKRCV